MKNNHVEDPVEDEAETDDLVETALFCTSCEKHHVIALPGDAILRRVLTTLTCPSCASVGALLLDRTKRR